MKAILLCAGQGRRLLPLTDDRPKCLVEVGGRTMLERQIRALAAIGIDEIVVATGFRAAQIDALLGGLDGSLPPIRTTLNPFFTCSDNLATCWLTRHEMTEPFVLINGDTLFEPAVAGTLLAEPDAYPILVTVDRKPGYDEDDMKVVIEDDRVAAIGKQHFDRIDAESIGMLRFNVEGARLFREELDRMMREPHGQARWYLSAIDVLARDRHVGYCDIRGLRWCEIDTPSDLAQAASRLEPAADRPGDDARRSSQSGRRRPA
ncbi:MAG: phosphocholine cytidylyltransferase family protein [Wenzhouxiangellaceae bacterium]|nr:phosphocholine cytidylyltransferase family protein [Wenzhouxiangellaceae bacterium]